MRLILLFMISMWLSIGGAYSDFHIEQIGPDLSHPWGMDIVDDRTVLVTTREGQLYQIDLKTGASHQIHNLPEVAHFGQGGLLDVAIKGDTLFLCYAKPIGGLVATAIEKARLENHQLTGRMTIFTSNRASGSAHHFGCRLALQDGMIYASFGDRGARYFAQKPAYHDGSIIRINQDASVPDDNPRLKGWAEGIFSIGHRNPQGMAIHPETGAIFTHEHGPQGGDEVNIITKGGNYGWPLVSHGKEYGTDKAVSKLTTHPDMIDPLWVWIPSIAPSGMAFYPQDAAMFPDYQDSLLIGSLKFKRLYQLRFDETGKVIDETILLEGALGRIRDVAVTEEGAILILNDANVKAQPSGGLYRLTP